MKIGFRFALLVSLVTLPVCVFAHPMGNFSINHHSTIRFSSGTVSITTILDFAEISTFQLFPDPRKAEEHAGEWAAHLHLRTDDVRLPLELRSVHSEIV